MTEYGRGRTGCCALGRGPSGALLALGLLLNAAASAMEPTAAQSRHEQTADPANRPAWTDAAPHAPMTGAPPWLDEVRAQRRAAEARRKSAREHFEARRRANDPWGAAQQDAWEENVERRREARRQLRDQELERFRESGPAAPPPWQERPDVPVPNRSAQSTVPHPSGWRPDPGTRSQAGEAQTPENPYPPTAPIEVPYYPQDWNNLWYYRGY